MVAKSETGSVNIGKINSLYWKGRITCTKLHVTKNGEINVKKWSVLK
jgi:hypothetical protein